MAERIGRKLNTQIKTNLVKFQEKFSQSNDIKEKRRNQNTRILTSLPEWWWKVELKVEGLLESESSVGSSATGISNS